MHAQRPPVSQSDPAFDRLAKAFDDAWERFRRTPEAWRRQEQPPVLDAALGLLRRAGGAAHVYTHAAEFDEAGLFAGSDWEDPALLRPELVSATLGGKVRLVALELLSELRILAIAEGGAHPLPDFGPEEARQFLETGIALNMARLFPIQTEAERISPGSRTQAIQHTFELIVAHIGYASVKDAVIQEAESMLAQRPILVQHICRMIAELGRGEDEAPSSPLFDALFRPSPATAGDPGLTLYRSHLGAMTRDELEAESATMAGHLTRTGLASAYHAVLVGHLRSVAPELLPTALGLSSTGREAMLTYRELVLRLIDESIFPETAQAIYGLYALLERGALYFPPVAPGLWRQIVHPIREDVQSFLSEVYGPAQPPRVWLLSGLVQILGQPLGVGQGNNPTCQSARALSLWAQVDPGYLLQLLLWAIRDGEIAMTFEGEALSSKYLESGLVSELHTELDPVSLILVPHLDRIYAEMVRRVEDREEDPHRWINPEFHGWWVQRGFAICVDIYSGDIVDFEGFLRAFHAYYHPYYNGNQPVIFPQPAGIASTTSAGDFVGWHAIAIERVGLAPSGEMRVYFHNPNNEGRQDWGAGVVTSVAGNGELPGESSLPFEQFCARLYLFHYDPLETGQPEAVDAEVVASVTDAVRETWAAGRTFR